jgi:hypothetical protein
VLLRRRHIALAATVVGLGLVGYLVLRDSGSDSTPTTAASPQAQDADPVSARQRAWAAQFARRTSPAEPPATDPAEAPAGTRAPDPAAIRSRDDQPAEVDPQRGSAGAGPDPRAAPAARALDAREAKVRKLLERLNQKKPAIERVRGASVAREILTRESCTAADAQQRYRGLPEPERAKMRQRCAPYNVTFTE